jgi:hypothetical protein
MTKFVAAYMLGGLAAVMVIHTLGWKNSGAALVWVMAALMKLQQDCFTWEAGSRFGLLPGLDDLTFAFIDRATVLCALVKPCAKLDGLDCVVTQPGRSYHRPLPLSGILTWPLDRVWYLWSVLALSNVYTLVLSPAISVIALPLAPMQSFLDRSSRE